MQAAIPPISKTNVYPDPVYMESHVDDDNNTVTLSLQRYSIFSLQNVENGHFDVTFTFKEKELHAHSFVLWTASEVFETMIFGAWAKKEPIPITAHSYEDFKEFLAFLYLGKCTITMDNVVALLDLAESYNVQLLKDKCDQFLTNITPTAENVFKICETLKLYSLNNAMVYSNDYITLNAATLLKNCSFLETKKDIVMDIVKMDPLVIKEEDLFDSIYKWAQFQYQNRETDKENSVWIKEELADILPYIRFPVMNIDYLLNIVVPLGFLFSSYNELSEILRDANAFEKQLLTVPASKYSWLIRKGFNLQLTDNRGNIGYAYVPKSIENLINQNQAISSRDYKQFYPIGRAGKKCYWNLDILKSVENYTSFNLDSGKIYLIRNSKGKLALKDFSTKVVQDKSYEYSNGSGTSNSTARIYSKPLPPRHAQHDVPRTTNRLQSTANPVPTSEIRGASCFICAISSGYATTEHLTNSSHLGYLISFLRHGTSNIFDLFHLCHLLRLCLRLAFSLLHLSHLLNMKLNGRSMKMRFQGMHLCQRGIITFCRSLCSQNIF